MLTRPDLQSRRGFPFRAVVVLAVLAAGWFHVRCIPDRQPNPQPAVVDCTRDDLSFACTCQLAAETALLKMIAQVRP